MLKRTFAAAVVVLSLIGIVRLNFAQRAPVPATVAMSSDQEAALVKQYCQGCHNPTTKSGSLDLTAVNFTRIDQHGEIAEKMIRKLRAGMMPPPGNARPEKAVINSFASSLETAMDRAAALRPNPGNHALQ